MIKRHTALGGNLQGLLFRVYRKAKAFVQTLCQGRHALAESPMVMLLVEGEGVTDYLQTFDSPLDTYDGELFTKLVERGTIISKTEVIFVFKTGVEVVEGFWERVSKQSSIFLLTSLSSFFKSFFTLFGIMIAYMLLILRA